MATNFEMPVTGAPKRCLPSTAGSFEVSSAASLSSPAGALRLLTIRGGNGFVTQRDVLERIAVAPDMTGTEVPANHQGRGVGKARKQLATGFGRLPGVGIGRRRPVEMGHLAGMMGNVP